MRIFAPPQVGQKFGLSLKFVGPDVILVFACIRSHSYESPQFMLLGKSLMRGLSPTA
jgi:hypothetical protein